MEKKVFFFLIILFSVLPGYGYEKGIKNIEIANSKKFFTGKYYAILIGIDEYCDPEIPDLNSPVNDVEELASVLENRYSFRVIKILNQSATKRNIYQKLRETAEKAGKDDSILLYYAGHGEIDRSLGGGWWIPNDAKAGDFITYLDNAHIQKIAAGTKARHFLLVSDSCYSGTLLGNSRSLGIRKDFRYYTSIFNQKSRLGITSGNITPVTDYGPDNHSLFGYMIIETLKNSEDDFMTAMELYTKIASIVGNNSDQTPMCRPIKNTGDMGGEFIFISSLKSDHKNSPPEVSELKSSVLKTKVYHSDPVIKKEPEQVFEKPVKLKLKKPCFVNSLGMEFVLVNPGKFIMGSKQLETRIVNDEKPHKVVIKSSYYIQTTEVTIGQYRSFLIETGNESGIDWKDKDCPLRRDSLYSLSENRFSENYDQPMVEVSWKGAFEFVKWLSKKEGLKYSLPTEAQWEFAARGRKKESFNNTEIMDRIGWYNKNSQERSHRVGTKEPNRLGLFDMQGNVWEWCYDYYGEYSNGVLNDPKGPKTGLYRVIRGGSWFDEPDFCRTAVRSSGLPDGTGNRLGFRTVILIE